MTKKPAESLKKGDFVTNLGFVTKTEKSESANWTVITIENCLCASETEFWFHPLTAVTVEDDKNSRSASV